MMNFINWFIKSSANKAAISLTIKGLIPFLVLLGVDSQIADTSANYLVEALFGLGQLFTLAVTIYGFVRKMIITFKQ